MRAFLVGLTVLLAATACQPSGAPAPRAAGAAESRAHHEVAGERLLRDDGGGREAPPGRARGRLRVPGVGIKNETDLTEQVNLVEQAVAPGAAAIVIAPADSKALVPALAPRPAAGRHDRQHRQPARCRRRARGRAHGVLRRSRQPRRRAAGGPGACRETQGG